MSFDLALRATELMLALALLQQSLEHARQDPWPYLPRAALCLALLSGLASGPVILALLAVQLSLLHRYQGPYNGGSDKMTLLILSVLGAVYFAPSRYWQELALSYLAVQLLLSYVVSGWVKLCNPDWRHGTALQDIFRFSAYPVSDAMRTWADRPGLLRVASWGVIALELLFPLALLHPAALGAALCLTAAFHLANAICFGLHRFFWIWLCAYPALIWFQARAILPWI